MNSELVEDKRDWGFEPPSFVRRDYKIPSFHIVRSRSS